MVVLTLTVPEQLGNLFLDYYRHILEVFLIGAIQKFVFGLERVDEVSTLSDSVVNRVHKFLQTGYDFFVLGNFLPETLT